MSCNFIVCAHQIFGLFVMWKSQGQSTWKTCEEPTRNISASNDEVSRLSVLCISIDTE